MSEAVRGVARRPDGARAATGGGRCALIEQYAAAAASHFGYPADAVFGRNLRWGIQRARSLAMALAAEEIGDLTSRDIAAQFDRDRATLWHHARAWKRPENAKTWNAVCARLRKAGIRAPADRTTE